MDFKTKYLVFLNFTNFNKYGSIFIMIDGGIIVKLDCKKITQLSNIDIYNGIKNELELKYNSIKYIGISKKEFDDLVMIEINNIKNIHDINLDYNIYLNNKINECIRKYISKLINDSNTSYEIINNFINNKIYHIRNFSLLIKYFNRLNEFFEMYNYTPDPDIIIDLINNNDTFNQMVTKVYNKFKDNLNIVLNDDNNLLVLSIETYCMLNNIQINNDKCIDNERKYCFNDSVNMYINDLKDITLLTSEEEKKLAYKLKQGDKIARKKFIESNLGLVTKLANNYTGYGLSLQDLIQEGNIGLITAVDRFDIEKGYNFSMYATWWIKYTMKKALANKVRNIRIPNSLYEKITKYNKAVHILQKRLDKTPTLEEISKETNIPMSQIEILKIVLNDTASIESLIEDNETEIFLTLDDNSIEDIIEEMFLKKDINNILCSSNLKKREIEIIKYRFGFYTDDMLTLEEVAKRFNLSKERIRQIEEKVLKNLKLRLYNMGYEIESNKKNKKIKTIYEYFEKYTKAQIDKILSKLSKDEFNLIIARYGSDLNNPVNTKISRKQKNNFYSKLLPKMKRLLEDSNYLFSNSNNRKYITIYEYFNNYTKEQVDEILHKLDEEDLELLNIYFCNNSKNRTKLNNNQNRKIHNTIIPKIKKLLANPDYEYVHGHNRKKIYNYFNDYSKEQVDEAINKLIENDKKLLIACFGTDLNVSPTNKISNSQRSNLYGILLPKIRKYLENPNYVCIRINKRKFKDIYECFNNYTKEQIDEMLSKLSKEELELIDIYFYKDIENSTKLPADKRNKFNHILMPKMKKLLEDPDYKCIKGRRRKTIYDYFKEYTKQQVDEAIKKISDKDKELLTICYGTNLNIIPTTKITPKQRSNLYSVVLPKIRRLLDNPNRKNKRTGKTIYEFYSDYTKEQIDEMVNKLDNKDMEIFKIRFENDSKNGLKITQKQKNRLYNKLIPKMNKLLENPNYIIEQKDTVNNKTNNINQQIDLFNKEECIKILEYLKNPTFNQMLENLSVKEAIIISLRLGYVDNKRFSIESISNFLNIDEEEVNEVIKKVLLLYKDSITSFMSYTIDSVSNNKIFIINDANKK